MNFLDVQNKIEKVDNFFGEHNVEYKISCILIPPQGFLELRKTVSLNNCPIDTHYPSVSGIKILVQRNEKFDIYAKYIGRYSDFWTMVSLSEIEENPDGIIKNFPVSIFDFMPKYW